MELLIYIIIYFVIVGSLLSLVLKAKKKNALLKIEGKLDENYLNIKFGKNAEIVEYLTFLCFFPSISFFFLITYGLSSLLLPSSNFQNYYYSTTFFGWFFISFWCSIVLMIYSSDIIERIYLKEDYLTHIICRAHLSKIQRRYPAKKKKKKKNKSISKNVSFIIVLIIMLIPNILLINHNYSFGKDIISINPLLSLFPKVYKYSDIKFILTSDKSKGYKWGEVKEGREFQITFNDGFNWSTRGDISLMQLSESQKINLQNYIVEKSKCLVGVQEILVPD